MNVLEQLWEGAIHPNERAVESGSEFERLQRAAQAQEDRLMELISPEAKEAYREFCLLEAEMQGISDRDFFIQGYRLGVRLLLAATGEYDSQLPMLS